MTVMQDAVDVLPSMLEHLEVGTEPERDVPEIARRADALAEGQAAADREPVAEPEPVAEKPRGMDPVLYEIFRNETDVHLMSIESFPGRCCGSGHTVSADR